ncbi:MAG: fibronectin type III domain-containing protein [Capsulimonadaceae bacterium]
MTPQCAIRITACVAMALLAAAMSAGAPAAPSAKYVTNTLDWAETDRPYTVAFSPDSRWLAWGTESGAVHIVNVATQQSWPVAIAPLHGSIEALAFSPTFHSARPDPDLMMAAATSDGAVTLLYGNGAPLPIYKGRSTATALTFGGETGEYLAAGFHDGQVIIWTRDATTGGYERSDFSPMYYARPVLSLASHGDSLAIGYKNTKIALVPNCVTPNGTEATMLQDHSDAVNWLAFSADGRRLASASDDTSVIVWDTSTNRGTVYHYQANDAAVKSVALSVAGDSQPFGYMAAGYADGGIGLWRYRGSGSFDPIAKVPLESGGSAASNGVHCVSISPDARYLASASDSRLRVWSLPVQPTAAGLNARAGNARVTLTWADSDGATSFTVYRSTTAGGEGKSPVAAGIAANSYTDTGLSNGTPYYYTVAAVNAGGESLPSPEASVTPEPPIPPAPAAPSGLVATHGGNQVALTWTAGADATSYNVYRSTVPGGEGTTAHRTGITTGAYTDSGLTAGLRYYYTVAAVNAGGTSAVSTEASATPLAPPVQVAPAPATTAPAHPKIEPKPGPPPVDSTAPSILGPGGPF